MHFLKTELDQHREEYNNLPASFFENLQGYRLFAHQDQCELSRRYVPQNPFSGPDEVLNEHMYLLERQ